MIDSEMDKIPLIQRKTKTEQQQPQQVGQSPIQETFMMREYTHTELVDIPASFQ